MPCVAQLARSAAQLCDGERVGHRQMARTGRDVVVERRHGEIGTPHASPGQAQALERLRRRDLVNEVQVDVEQVAPAVERLDDVRVPQLVEQRAWATATLDAMVRPMALERVDHRAFDRRARPRWWWRACRPGAPGRPGAGRAPAPREWPRRRRRLRAACAPCGAASGRCSRSRRSDWRCRCRRCRAPSRAPARTAPPAAQRRRRQQPERSRDHGRLVAQDVAEQVVGQHDVELGRRRRQAHREGVHIHVAQRDVGIVARRCASRPRATTATSRARWPCRPR